MIKKSLILASALFLSIVLFELFLRYSPFSYGLSTVLYDKDIGMWHKKNFSSYSISECYETKYYFDKDGLIGLDYPYNSNKKSVLILGDSFTEAIMVENKHILHNALWREYQGQYNFINYGLSGTAPTQHFVILTKKAKLKNVDTVLQIINIDSDIYDVDPNSFNRTARPKVAIKFLSINDYALIPPREQNLKDKIMGTVGNSQFYIPINKVRYKLKEVIKELKLEIKNEKNTTRIVEKTDLSNNWLQIEGAVYQTKKYLDKQNIKYKIIIKSNKNENIVKLVNILNSYSIPFFDLNRVSKEYKIDLPTFSCDKHWNELAHQNIAKIIYKINFLENKESETK